MKSVLLFCIRLYRRFISPLKPPCCRFYPTCSSYALKAVSEYGALRGGFLVLRRIFKCHPFHPGGYDPVPESLPESRLCVHVRKLCGDKHLPRPVCGKPSATHLAE